MPKQESLWSTMAPIGQKPIESHQTEEKGSDDVSAFLASLAKSYNDATIAYSNTICSGSMVNGKRIPATSVELKFVGRHTRLLLQKTYKTALDEHGILPGAVNTAIRIEQSRQCVKS